MQRAARSFVEEPINSPDLLCLCHLPISVVLYYPINLQVFATSHISTKEVRKMAQACSSVDFVNWAHVLEQSAQWTRSADGVAPEQAPGPLGSSIEGVVPP